MGRRPQVSRAEVLRAARELFAERGFEATSLSAIGSRLGISPAAVLRHAATKDELFAAAMASSEFNERMPMDFLQDLDGSEDPLPVLKHLAEAFVPFIEARLGENIARFMHARNSDEARTIRLPFDPRSKPNPPQRGIAIVEDYFRRAARAGTLRLKDPRSAALAFLGALQSYVFLHKVLFVFEPPLPLKQYIATILEIWSNGAFEKKFRGKRKKRRS
jgi:AcrR family transcriptional regulator